MAGAGSRTATSCSIRTPSRTPSRSGRSRRGRRPGNDTLSIRNDPRFVDPEDGDYSLRLISAAYTLPLQRVRSRQLGAWARTCTPTSIWRRWVPPAPWERRTLSGDRKTATYEATLPAAGLYRVYARRCHREPGAPARARARRAPGRRHPERVRRARRTRPAARPIGSDSTSARTSSTARAG